MAGPTAVGKTALCVRLAKFFETDIISADSRQFYKEMQIGTAKPTIEEMGGVKHYFVDTHHVSNEMNAGQYETEVLNLLNGLFREKDLVILTGGSGLYIKAVCEGFDKLPEVDLQIRNELNERLRQEGLEKLVEELKECDPVYALQVDVNNPQRVVRALEVYYQSGVPFSAYRKGDTKQRDFDIIKIGLERERQELYSRIDKRMNIMIENGLFEEVESLISYKHLNALQTVGYKEVFDYMEGKTDREEAIRLLKRNSRRYAKRQLTWFKKDKDFKWFHPEDEKSIVAFIKSNI